MDKFKEFVGLVPQSEDIDDLLENTDHEGIQIADFLFSERRFVCELKTLNKDTKQKVDAIVDGLKGRPDFPIFYGEWELSKILQNLSDGNKIHEKIAYSITSPIENTIKDANRQIRDTKTLLNLPNSRGIVVIINESVDILDANIVSWRINQCLTKKSRDGSLRFESIEAIWFLDEAHVVEIQPDLKGPISLQISGPEAHEGTISYLDYLMTQWACFIGIPIQFIANTNLPPKRIFSKTRIHERRSKKAVTLQESWEIEYRSFPYLRGLSNEGLYKYGREIVEQMTPHYLKKGPKKSQGEVMKDMRQFTDLLQEIQHRGIDIRKFEFNKVDFTKYI